MVLNKLQIKPGSRPERDFDVLTPRYSVKSSVDR